MKARTAANLVLWLLFPGFFVYNIARAMSLIPTIPNYFGMISVLSIPLFILCFPKSTGRTINRSPAISLPFIGLLLWCGAWVLLHMALGVDSPQGAVSQIVIMLVFWVSLFLVGIHCDADARRFRRWLYLALFIMLAVAVWYIDPAQMIMNPRAIFGEDDLPSYQGFARSAIVTCFAIIAGVRRDFNRWLLFAVCSALMFALGARSEFVAFVAAVAGLELIYIMQRPRALPTAGICAALMVTVVVVWWDEISGSRQFQLFDLSEASSWLARQEMTVFAFEQVRSNFLTGVFGGHFYFADDGSAGNYAHNALSAWVSFGLGGFFIYVGLSLAALWLSARMAVSRQSGTKWRLAFYLNASSLLLIVFAKPVFWPVVALGWGMAANASVDREARTRAGERWRPVSVSLTPQARRS